MTVTPPADIPPTNPSPDADELAALRKEKAERDAAAQAEREKEVADLRAYKAEQERKAATAVKAPEKKADKAPVVDTPPASTLPAAETKKRKGLWWPDAD